MHPFNIDSTGGIGAVLFDYSGECKAWFGFTLDGELCKAFGSDKKETIIYELELVATVFALSFWEDWIKDGLQVAFGDNDSVRFSLIKGSCLSACGLKLMHFHLKKEADSGMNTWYARVPTEANISDFPSRGLPHPLLEISLDSSLHAKKKFLEMIGNILDGQAI